MKTTRIISNISYNTIDHFQGVIYDLVQRNVIDWAYWILHKAEDDETKDHIHFVLKPSERLDTSKLEKEFLEIDFTNTKPLGVTKVWKYTSSLDDWILYCSHDIGYLASKGQIRKYHYTFNDFGYTDEDAFIEDWHNVNRVAYHRLQALAEAVEKRIPFALLVQQGVIPIAQRSQYEYQYNALFCLSFDGQTGRKQSHNDDVEQLYIEQKVPDGFVRIDDTDEDIPF